MLPVSPLGKSLDAPPCRRRDVRIRDRVTLWVVLASCFVSLDSLAFAQQNAQSVSSPGGIGQLATGAVFGAVFGALVAGLLKMVGDWINQASSRRALAAGFTAEILVGVKAITTATSAQSSKGTFRNEIIRFLEADRK
jgi:hypothetical protein